MLSQFHLPLLTRELIEQSNRRRTYVFRVIYAVALFGLTGWTIWSEVGEMWASGNRAILTMGIGRTVLDSVVQLQFAGIYLFLPALVCGSITSEKERETLGLLIVTRLGPWTILFEKLLARLVPMSGYLLLSLPLLAVARTLGGVSNMDILWAAIVLCVTMFLVASFALMWSVLARTTASALVLTYVTGAIFMLLGNWVVITAIEGFASLLTLNITPAIYPSGPYPYTRELFMLQNSPQSTFLLGSFAFNGTALFKVGRITSSAVAGYLLLPSILAAGACLCLARWQFLRRAFPPAGSFIPKLLRWFDDFFHRINQNRLTRGIVLVRDKNTLPLFKPVAWRETVKKSLGTTRYLVRLLVLLELPLLPLVSMMLFDLIEGRQLVLPRPAGMVYPVWFFAALFVSVHATGIIANERSHQTLDVLLSTPLTSREIVSQKLSGVWKLCFVLAIPFATAVFYELMTTIEWSQPTMPIARNPWTGQQYNQPVFRRWPHLFWSITSFLVYLSVMAWLGMWLSLRLASRLRALVTQILLIVAVCAIPLLFVSSLRGVMTTGSMIAVVISPLAALMQIELHSVPFDEATRTVTLALNMFLWAGVACWLRLQCYRHFAELTGRLDPLTPSRVASAVEKPALGFEAAGGTG